MKRDAVDFFEVAPGHAAIHLRLENWAQWHYSVGGSSAAPMFRLYQPDNYERTGPTRSVDVHDAQVIAKAVAMLPLPHRQAITWNYVEGGSPTKARKKIGVTFDGLMLLVRDGRTMLVNRGV